MEKIDELELETLGFSKAKKDDKKVFIALAANYGNLGDYAITVAQKAFIQDTFPDRKIIEIPAMNFENYIGLVNPILNDDDIITIIGGGNMGNLYPMLEEYRRDIIARFPNNKIVSFPQSISFNEDKEGQDAFQVSIDIYGKHEDLTIFIREEKSYNIAKNKYTNPVKLVPDIVFYLKNKFEDKYPREQVSLCFRDDDEKVTPSNIINDLSKLIEKNNLTPKIASTHIGNTILKAYERDAIFENLIKEFQKSKLVITDRLHGMILAIVTNTPCIAFDNSNKKISSTYSTWLNNCPNIKLVTKYDEEELSQYIQELVNADHNDTFNINKEFSELLKALKKAQN